MFALLECVCEPTLSHQTASIKPLQKCGPYMPMAVLIRVTELKVWNKEEYKKKIDQSTDKIATNISMAIKEGV